MTETVEKAILSARETYLENSPAGQLHHLSADSGALWSKIDHLLYQPILGLERPRSLYYYQGDGLDALYGFTYKYLTLEHFLGQLTRVQVGAPLAESLSAVYVQTWYPGDTPLTLFVDWHTKPHWTKSYSHAGHIAMWGRTMPGVKQLVLNGADGRYLGGWNYPIDAHLTHVLVELEAALEHTLSRPIACTIVDSEGGGLPLGERYAAAGRSYISVLPDEHAHRLADFDLEGEWQVVKDDPEREVVLAHWADPKKAAQDPRQFALMRPVGQTNPTRIYTGQFTDISVGQIPWQHRRRWAWNELRIRDLIQGANLNLNYGYTYTEVPQRTRQRQWEAAQERVAVTERQVSDHQAAVRHLRQQLANLQDTLATKRRDLERQLKYSVLEAQRRRKARQRLEQSVSRAQHQVDRLRQKIDALTQRFTKRQRDLFQQLHGHTVQAAQARQHLSQRIALRDAIDTQTLCRERELEKDQIMLDLQILLANLHDRVATAYLAPEWRKLTLEKATQMIYRKAGRVTWHSDRVQVELKPYRYPDQQRAMEVTCACFNAANIRWRDGRLLHISVRALG